MLVKTVSCQEHIQHTNQILVLDSLRCSNFLELKKDTLKTQLVAFSWPLIPFLKSDILILNILWY
jgi:hypothetical protein